MTNVILVVAISASVILAGITVTLVSGYASELGTLAQGNSSTETKEKQIERELEKGTSVFQPYPVGGELTGNLTVFLLPADYQKHDPSDIIRKIDYIVGDAVTATQHSNYLGASPRGQYGDEQVVVTWDDDPNGFRKGDVITMEVVKRAAETVKFYIDPEVKNPVSSNTFAISDIQENHGFGNGITCCGIELREDIYPPDTNVQVVFFVVDWAFDEYVLGKIDRIKAAIS